MTLVERAEQLIRDCEIGAGCGVCPVLRELLATVASQAHTLSQLQTALRDLVDDLEARWDMNDPRTNPGIRHYVEQARVAIANAEAHPHPIPQHSPNCAIRTDDE